MSEVVDALVVDAFPCVWCLAVLSLAIITNPNINAEEV